MTRTSGRYQVAHHLMIIKPDQNPPPGYIKEWIKGKTVYWVSEVPTHYFDSLTDELTPLDETRTYDRLNLSVKITAQKYKTLEELRESLAEKI